MYCGPFSISVHSFVFLSFFAGNLSDTMVFMLWCVHWKAVVKAFNLHFMSFCRIDIDRNATRIHDNLPNVRKDLCGNDCFNERFLASIKQEIPIVRYHQSQQQFTIQHEPWPYICTWNIALKIPSTYIRLLIKYLQREVHPVHAQNFHSKFLHNPKLLHIHLTSYLK